MTLTEKQKEILARAEGKNDIYAILLQYDASCVEEAYWSTIAMFGRKPYERTPRVRHHKVEEVITKFHKALVDKADIYLAIAALVRDITWAHPFANANHRTAYRVATELMELTGAEVNEKKMEEDATRGNLRALSESEDISKIADYLCSISRKAAMK